jgi:lipid-binding SYLF domain-containing protein
MGKTLASLLVFTVVCGIPALGESTREGDARRMQNAAEVLREIERAPDKAIPDKIMRSARCIAIIPGERKVAFFVGGNWGKGLVSCRLENGGWSAPLFLSMGGGSFGFQWGATSTDIILVFRNRKGLEKQLSDKFQLGADAEGAAGPVGRDAGADTDIAMRAEVLTYSRSRGVFAGIDLKGAVLQPDDSGNQAEYGNAALNRDAILTGGVPVPPGAAPLLRALAAGTVRPGRDVRTTSSR